MKDMAGVPLIVTEEPMFKDEIFVYGTCHGRREQMRGTKPGVVSPPTTPSGKAG